MPDSPHHAPPPDSTKPEGQAGTAAATARRRRIRSWHPDMWMLTLLVVAVTAVHPLTVRLHETFGSRLDGGRRDAGSPTVETIGWVSFALVIVVVLGTILRAKLTTFAQSLPTSLHW